MLLASLTLEATLASEWLERLRASANGSPPSDEATLSSMSLSSLLARLGRRSRSFSSMSYAPPAKDEGSI